jgi:hypothetical protein
LAAAESCLDDVSNEPRGILARYAKLKIKPVDKLFSEVTDDDITAANTIAASRKPIHHSLALDLSLPLKGSMRNEYRGNCRDVLKILAEAVPNIWALNLSRVKFDTFSYCHLELIGQVCKRLKKLTWHKLHLSDDVLLTCLSACTELQELYMDKACLLQGDTNMSELEGAVGAESDGDSAEKCLFYFCHQTLERVSIMGLQYSNHVRTGKISQGALMKFVRKAPMLTWFRSDLHPDNVAILQEERPNVTFYAGKENVGEEEQKKVKVPAPIVIQEQEEEEQEQEAAVEEDESPDDPDWVEGA